MKCYIVLFIARSGSTYLGRELERHRLCGELREVFSPLQMEWIDRRFGISGLDHYIPYMLNRFATADGLFGMKGFPAHIERFGAGGSVLERFPPLHWFYLRRRNIVAQAISLVVAKHRGVWHSSQDPTRTDWPNYDAATVDAHIRFIVSEEQRAESLIAARQAQPVRVFYEDVVRDMHNVVALFSEALGVVARPWDESKDPITPVTAPGAAEWEQRYRVERCGYLDEIAEARGL